ncbi:hypothetical protein TH53_03915 [Pedobacter lusitanus]|uniref:Contig14, whole genome shotgun sequence n=2 Tax=Pedobacter lusitanus TaxID=1503925 RepID=A0A0D0GQL2_9SPHI|nr:hypothetical protein TH53_03915 [Pedobacter lusitanus]
MSFYKYRLHIVIAFISIFTVKMIISAAPVFVGHMDKNVIKTVILQLEQEHSSDCDSGKSLLKFIDYKPIDFHNTYTYVPLLVDFGIRNCYIDHFKRYVDPYHPSVPTPPPNFC